MDSIPDDIFTEPDDVADDTLAHLGPLRRLAGIWEGRKGVDLNPKAEGPEEIRQVAAEIHELEQRHAIPNGQTRLMPLVSETPRAALTITA